MTCAELRITGWAGLEWGLLSPASVLLFCFFSLVSLLLLSLQESFIARYIKLLQRLFSMGFSLGCLTCEVIIAYCLVKIFCFSSSSFPLNVVSYLVPHHNFGCSQDVINTHKKPKFQQTCKIFLIIQLIDITYINVYIRAICPEIILLYKTRFCPVLHCWT